MKLCILGNSHIACLRSALQPDIAIAREHDITFFGAGRDLLTELLPDQERRRLTAGTDLAERLKRTSGGLSSIETTDYDAFLVCGLSSQVQNLVPAFAEEGYSSQLRFAAAQDFWKRQSLLEVIRLLRSVSDAPIWAMHAPLEALSNPERIPVAAYADMIAASQREVFDPLTTILLRQPDSTLNGGGATQAKFTSGSTRLGDKSDNLVSGHSKNDIAHMNAEFGSIMLGIWTRELSARMAGSRVPAE